MSVSSPELLEARRRITQLEEKLEERDIEIDQLKQQLGQTDILYPHLPHLTKSETKVLRVIEARPFVTREIIYQSLYWEFEGDGPEMKILDVFVCKLRKKLRVNGIEIMTLWGQGWRMTDENKRKLRPQEQVAA